ncbi:FHA domain-containing protein [Demequina litorisediminis]|uniref:FHA domain-containing protein n=1 Tax=Demequina litorisediminis TaxID=1849022 RepID=A0ABQ6IEI9_9MICO|nr:FHA domain-containing protein [Demequina litorisediminis]GMA36200.1 hypothetical protein GCM10025876_24040 [Demequina litorisediminis]
MNARQIPSVLPPAQTVAPAVQPGAALPQVPAPHQRPRTTKGSAIAGNPASVGRQVAAFTVDVVAVAVVSAAVTLLTSSAALGALAAVEMIVALWVLEARTGLTAGNAALGLRTSRSDAAYSPGAGRSLIRLVITGAGFLAAVVGAWVIAASGLWDPSGRSRSLAARASGTVTVRPPVRTTAPGAGVSPASTTGAVASRVPERVVTQSAPLRVVPDEAARSAPVQASTTVAQAADAHAAAPVPPRQEPVATRQSPHAAPAPAPAARVEPGASPSPVAPAAPVAPTPAPAPVAPAAPVAETAPTAPATGAAVSSTAPVTATTPAPAVASAQQANEPQSAPIAPTAAQAAPLAAAPQHEGALLLVFDTGQRETITLPAHVNLGRQPDPHATGDTLVAVDDPDRTVSKTHARLEHDDGATWVTDLGSTNGTEAPGRGRHRPSGHRETHSCPRRRPAAHRQPCLHRERPARHPAPPGGSIMTGPRLAPPRVPTGRIPVQAPPEIAPAEGSGILMSMLPMLGSVGAIVMVTATNQGLTGLLTGGMFLLSSLGFVAVNGWRQRSQRNAQVRTSRREYLAYLTDLRATVRVAAKQQRRAANWANPAPSALPYLAEERTRAWERSPGDDDFLVVRVGRNDQPLCVSLEAPELPSLAQARPCRGIGRPPFHADPRGPAPPPLRAGARRPGPRRGHRRGGARPRAGAGNGRLHRHAARLRCRPDCDRGGCGFIAPLGVGQVASAHPLSDRTGRRRSGTHDRFSPRRPRLHASPGGPRTPALGTGRTAPSTRHRRHRRRRCLAH